MNLKEYMRQAERTCPKLESEFIDQLHMVIGICTEANELLDAYKKRLAYHKELDLVNIGEELFDILWYQMNLCRMLNLDPEKMMDINIKKLQARYPDKFDCDKAIYRDLAAERKILEEIKPDF
jgi:NTP pyrophosphatase (non-canonical NTP hydrolase)